MSRIAGMRVVGGMVLSVILSGCTLVGGDPGPVQPGPAEATGEVTALPEGLTRSVYGGSVTFDGNRIALTLELVGSEGDLSARLSIPSLALDAGGAGEVEGDGVTLDLAYPGDCPGRVRLDGSFREGRRRIEGRLTASDCTGEESGAVVLLIRPPA